MNYYCLKKFYLYLCISIFITSCSFNNTSNLSNVWDPLEPVNRTVFSFNMFVDTYTLEPIAKAYDYVVPEFATNALSNHFNWIKTPLSAFNSSLQGKHSEAINSIVNFSINTLTLGFYDLTGESGYKNTEDFDQTLGVYNISSGPYIVIPFLGPTTARGMTSNIIDGVIDPLNLLGPKKVIKVNSAELPLKAVNTRAEYMDQINDLKYNSLDAYSVFRSVYFQRLISETQDANTEEDNITNVNSGAIDAFFIQNQ